MAGQYWVAAGIAFTSFEMIQAQAVISVSFGVDLQIGVVGTCSMTFPTGDPDPVAYVEIDVVASFTPSTGLLAVDGQAVAGVVPVRRVREAERRVRVLRVVLRRAPG